MESGALEKRNKKKDKRKDKKKYPYKYLGAERSIKYQDKN